jgi:hypothetical protein
MKFIQMDTPAAGEWSRDCELISLAYYDDFILDYHRDEDNTYWRVRTEGFLTFKLIGEEFSREGYLADLPIGGEFFEILDSPWIGGFSEYKAEIVNKCKHFVLQFYDETVEILAQNIIFEQLKGKASLVYIEE